MKQTITQLLASYPRSRPPIPDAYQPLFASFYRTNRDAGSSFLQRLIHSLESWMHHRVADHQRPGPILELGPGLLNHLPYESDSIPYDIVEPNASWYTDHPLLPRLRQIYADIAAIPLVEENGEGYGRILSIAVLEHIADLPSVLARSALLLQEDGLFQAGIPAEGGFLWGLGWRCTSSPALFLKTGLNYKILNRHEHINQGQEIVALVRHFFEDVELQHYPLPWYHFSFYLDICARKPKREVCRGYLKSLTSCGGSPPSPLLQMDQQP